MKNLQIHYKKWEATGEATGRSLGRPLGGHWEDTVAVLYKVVAVTYMTTHIQPSVVSQAIGCDAASCLMQSGFRLNAIAIA